MLELMALMGGFLAATAIGLPLAGRFARPQGWRAPYPDTPVEPREHWHGVGFEPVDFGPDIMKWPSENPWEVKQRPEPLWPSQTWNDTHFGQHWNRNGQSTPPVVSMAQETASRQTAAKAKQAKKSADQRQERMKDAVRQAAAQAQERAQQVAVQAGQAAYEAAEQQFEDTTGVTLDEIPKPAELERLVGELGLAGTVQVIMQRTNWDFRTAAQYLAKARRR